MRDTVGSPVPTLVDIWSSAEQLATPASCSPWRPGRIPQAGGLTSVPVNIEESCFYARRSTLMRNTLGKCVTRPEHKAWHCMKVWPCFARIFAVWVTAALGERQGDGWCHRGSRSCH